MSAVAPAIPDQMPNVIPRFTRSVATARCERGTAAQADEYTTDAKNPAAKASRAEQAGTPGRAEQTGRAEQSK
jgi:hypothetical protein